MSNCLCWMKKHKIKPAVNWEIYFFHSRKSIRAFLLFAFSLFLNKLFHRRRILNVLIFVLINLLAIISSCSRSRRVSARERLWIRKSIKRNCPNTINHVRYIKRSSQTGTEFAECAYDGRWKETLHLSISGIRSNVRRNCANIDGYARNPLLLITSANTCRDV